MLDPEPVAAHQIYLRDRTGRPTRAWSAPLVRVACLPCRNPPSASSRHRRSLRNNLSALNDPHRCCRQAGSPPTKPGRGPLLHALLTTEAPINREIQTRLMAALSGET